MKTFQIWHLCKGGFGLGATALKHTPIGHWLALIKSTRIAHQLILDLASTGVETRNKKQEW